MTLYMVFDVESVGLHGPAFAVGYVVVDSETGREWECGRFACPITDDSFGSGREVIDPLDLKWCEDNIPNLAATHETAESMRDEFWHVWREWRTHQEAILAADVPWPVEARFLARCVDDRLDVRRWKGPYPLVDIASVRLAKGLDPLGTGDRLPNELPQHDPLTDARQSARLLLEALSALAKGDGQ